MLCLLPQPRCLNMEDGIFFIGLHTRIVLCGAASGMARTAAAQLKAEIASACGVDLAITIGQPDREDICLSVGSGSEEQGYMLRITAANVVVQGNDDAGLLHGVQTLRQIIRQRAWRLPALTIEDAPALPARGFYHDVTRGRVPTLDWLKQLADEMCLYKLNQLQLYVEHTYLFRNLTELWHIGTPLTSEDIMALDDYCAARGIELVPSLSSFGHLMELLRTKTYRHLCELPDVEALPSTMPNRMQHHTINASDPEALSLITEMIGEFMVLFRSRKFNICADETFDLGRGRSQETMARLGERGYYTGFVKQLCEYVVSQGRQPMFWGDIVVRFADVLRELPSGTICLNWGYSADVQEESTRILAQSGALQYVCPGVNGWNRWMPHMRVSWENIRRMAAYGRTWGAVGMLNTDWGDYGHINDPRLSLPGMIYGACAAWNGELQPFEEINEDISRLAYGDRSGRVVSCLARLSECEVYSWRSIVRHKEWMQGTLEEKRDASPIGLTDEEQLDAADAQLQETMAGLQEACLHMDAAMRPMLGCWLLTGEAVSLWNHAAHEVCAGRKNAALAMRLERWLHMYEQMWRTVSRESELWRIRDVAAWYADQLR